MNIHDTVRIWTQELVWPRFRKNVIFFNVSTPVKVLGQVVWNKSNSSARQVNSDAVYSETTGISW